MITNFDDQDGEIWLDGRFVDWRDANVHVLTHGLHYSSSIFEGIRVYGGRIFRLEEHNQRLIDSAIEIACLIPYSLAELGEAVRDLVVRQGITDGYIRPIAWRGSQEMAVGGSGTSTHIAIAAWQWPQAFSDASKVAGINLHTSRWRRPAPDSAPVKAKGAGQYAIGTLARLDAESVGADDALFLDYRGFVAEATGANLFLVIDGELHTPVPDCFLDGITRRVVIELARSYRIRVFERHIPAEDLQSASEVFLTGTAYEIQPVRSIDDTEFHVGPVTKKLSDAYMKLVRA